LLVISVKMPPKKQHDNDMVVSDRRATDPLALYHTGMSFRAKVS